MRIGNKMPLFAYDMTLYIENANYQKTLRTNKVNKIAGSKLIYKNLWHFYILINYQKEIKTTSFTIAPKFQ